MNLRMISPRLGSTFIWLCLAGLLPACAQTRMVADAPAPSATPATAASLQGTAWQLTVAGDAPRPRLQFTSVTTVAGNTGCNSFTGPLASEGNSLRLGPLASTKRMCLGPPHETERMFLQALSDTRGMQRLGNQLQLLNEVAAVLVTLEAAEAKSP